MRGHEVRIGTRDPGKLEAWRAEVGPLASVTSGAECARWGELLIVSVLGSAVEDVLRAAGVEHFAGKVVIDASDPLDFRTLLEAFGWPVIDIGDIQGARWIEALSFLWLVYHEQTGKLHHAFKLIGK